MFKYHLSEDQLDKIQLVLQNGEEFMFVEDIISKENKRRKKQQYKEENKDQVNITQKLKRGRDRKSNWIEYLGYKFNALDKAGFKY